MGVVLVEIAVTEEAMMLADHLFQPVTKAVEEILVGGDDGAIGLEIDDRQGLVQGCQQCLGALQGGLLLGHVGGDLGDPHHFAVDHDGEIGRLQPHGLAGFRLANEATAAGDAVAQILPQGLVIPGIDVVGEAEGAVMLANHLVTFKSHDLEKQRVGEGDHSRRGELDEGDLQLDSLFKCPQFHHPCRLLTGFLACFLIPEHDSAPP